MSTKAQAETENKTYKNVQEMIADCFLYPGPDRCIILEDQFSYRGRLIIPDTAQRRPTTGTVLRIGPGVPPDFINDSNEVETLKVGDKIAFGTFSGTLYDFEQRPSWRVLNFNEVQGRLTREATKLLEVRV